MSKIEIKNGLFRFEGKTLGPITQYIADPHELKGCGVLDGVTHKTLPHNTDLLFAAGQKVVVGEFKQVADLVSSHQSHRLHRQLRNMATVADIVVLFVRGLNHDGMWRAVENMQHRDPRYRAESFWGDLANLQTLGVYLLPLSSDDVEAMVELRYYRMALATSGARAVAGTDRPKRDRQPGWVLRRIKGIGPVMSKVLLGRYGQPGKVVAAAQKRGTLNAEFPSIAGEIRKAYWEQ